MICQGLLVIRMLIEIATWVLVKAVISLMMIVVTLVLLKIFQFLERYELIFPLLLPSWESFLHGLGPSPWVALGAVLGLVGCSLMTSLMSLNQINRLENAASPEEAKRVVPNEKAKGAREYPSEDVHPGSAIWSVGLPGILSRMLIPLEDPRILRSWGTRIQRRCEKVINACSKGAMPLMEDVRLEDEIPIPPGFSHLPSTAQAVYLCMIVAGEEVLEAEAKVRGRMIPGYCWCCGAERRNPEGLTADGRCRLGCGEWSA